MLDIKLRRRLETMTRIPTIPYVISQVLAAVDNENLSASALAKMIERDQTLTMRVLTVANSPFYGFSRRISTIDLAIVILGLNTIKEIVMSLAIQKFFTNVGKTLFDVKGFWKYSVLCGAAGRVLARKMEYKLAGEAFVAGLVHDIGILILIQYFASDFAEIRKKQRNNGMTFVEAENAVLHCTHADIGAWLARKWKLPENIEQAVLFHHLDYVEAKLIHTRMQRKKKNSDEDFDQPLTIIVALSEWFAAQMGFKSWACEDLRQSNLFLADDLIEEMSDHDLLSPDSVIEVIKQEIQDEYLKASTLNEMINKQVPLYK
ncbi:MAG: HDOD domain-containing protein [Candidatus Kapabacteria bacterium]|nr:HDOD domain-containing protein [Candidatus Kapabacteria bacterium]